ncbi:MAG TPA: hypothetical protein VGD14_09435 [bacterium]
MKIKIIISVIITATALLRCPPIDFLISKIGMDDILRVMAIFGASSILAVYIYKINPWAGALVFCSAVSYIYPIYSLYSNLSLFTVTLYAAVYYVLVRDKIKAEYLINPMAIFAIIHSGFLILHFNGIFPGIYGNLKPSTTEVIGLMANPNDAAAALAICLPAVFRKKWCWAIPLIIAGFYCARSTGGVFGGFVASCIFLALSDMRFKKEIFAGIAMMIALFLVFIDRPAASVRLDTWIVFLDNHFNHTLTPGIKNQTIFGIGLGNWKFVRQSFGPVNGHMLWTNSHNTFVQGFIEMGFPFLIIMAGYTYSLLSRIKKTMGIEAAALGAIVTVCMTNSVFHMNAVNGLFVVLWLVLVEIKLKVGIQR